MGREEEKAWSEGAWAVTVVRATAAAKQSDNESMRSEILIKERGYMKRKGEGRERRCERGK